MARLKSLADLVTSCVDEEFRPYVALEHLESGTGRLLPNLELPERVTPEAGAAAVESGDVLFAKLRPYLAKTWLANRPVFASTELLCLRPRQGVDSRWLGYVCASRPFIDWAVATSDGTKMPRTSWDKLSEFQIAVPASRNQYHIADFIDAETIRIDSLITKKHRLHELLSEKFRSLVDDSVTEGKSTSVRRVVSLITSGPRGWSDRVVEEGFPFIRSANLQRDSLDLRTDNLQRVTEVTTAEGSRSTAKSGDIVIGITGANTGWVGLVGRDHSPGYVSQHVALLRPNDSVMSEWLALCLYSRRVQGQLAAGQYGGTKQQLGLEDLAEVSIFVPSRDRQLELVERVTIAQKRQLQIAGRLTCQIALLLERRQALITAAVTGELKIPEGVAG